jgi:hypothetical protein
MHHIPITYSFLLPILLDGYGSYSFWIVTT